MTCGATEECWEVVVLLIPQLCRPYAGVPQTMCAREAMLIDKQPNNSHAVITSWRQLGTCNEDEV